MTKDEPEVGGLSLPIWMETAADIEQGAVVNPPIGRAKLMPIEHVNGVNVRYACLGCRRADQAVQLSGSLADPRHVGPLDNRIIHA